MPRLFLTDEFVQRVRCPDEKDQELYWDHPKTLEGKIRKGSQSGLGLRVTKNGIKSFVHSFKFNGKRCRYVVGKADCMSVHSARLKVQTREASLDNGEDPNIDDLDVRRKHFLTFGELAEQYFEQRMVDVGEKHRWEFCRVIAPWLSKNRKAGNRRGINMRRAFRSFGEQYRDMRADAITPQHIDRFIRGIASDHSANSALKRLSALFNWADRMQIIDMRNPCNPIAKRKIIKKRRDYSPEDIANLSAYIFNPVIEALPALPENTGEEKRLAALKRGAMSVQNAQMLELCHFLGILFLTMARPNELKNARFDHFDLDRLIWHKHNTKGIKLSKSTYEYAARSVPIHPRVAEIVIKQQQRWPEAELVFPSCTDPSKPRDNFKRALTRFKALDGVPDHFQMYDIKRIAISLMITGQGVRREDVSHYVDHKGNLDTTLIYDLGFVDPMRPVATKLGELLGV